MGREEMTEKFFVGHDHSNAPVDKIWQLRESRDNNDAL